MTAREKLEPADSRLCQACKKPARNWAGRLCNTCYSREHRKLPGAQERIYANRRRNYQATGKTKARLTGLKVRYGLDAQAYAALLDGQGGMCAICKAAHVDAHRQRLVVDHCHTTGKLRGLLCSRCNTGIGHMKDSPETCLAAAAYLKEKR